MKVLTFGLDNRALLENDGHSKRWNSRMGGYVDQLDVIVEVRGETHYTNKWISENVRIIPINVSHPALYSFIAYKKALDEHKEMKYDLVTTEEPFRTGFAACLFKQKTGVAMSVEYHNDTFYNAEWINERPISHRIYISAGKMALRTADSLRCVSLKNYYELRRLSKGNGSKIIEVIPVPTEFYCSKQHDVQASAIRRQVTKKSDDIIILFVGRPIHGKRVNELIEAFGKIVDNYKNVYLLIVGDGPEYNSLTRLAKKNGDGQIIFKGYIPEEEIFGYYGACDIFVNPSHKETYGRIYIEAMSAGKPIVTTSSVGAVEDGLCIDRENSLVVQPGDRNDLKEALVRLIEDKGLRQKLGQNAIQAVVEKFDYEKSLINMKKFWEQTVDRNKNMQ